MHLAYSALRTNHRKGRPQLSDQHLQQRLDGYTAACQKYRQEIAAIRKYLPGWTPKFL